MKVILQKRVDIYVFITITGSISTFLLLSLGRYLRFYYYHWVDNSDGGTLVSNDIVEQKSRMGLVHLSCLFFYS